MTLIVKSGSPIVLRVGGYFPGPPGQPGTGGGAGTSLQLTQFTNGAAITSDNFHDALDAAIAAVKVGSTKSIQLPGGTFAMKARSIQLPFSCSGISITGLGSLATVMNWPAAYTGDGIEFNEAADNTYSARLSGFTLNGNLTGRHGIGGKNVVDAQFRDVVCSDWRNGAGLGADGGAAWFIGGGLWQNCSWYDCASLRCRRSVQADGINTSAFYNFRSNQNTGQHEFRVSHAQFSMYGGMFQTPIAGSSCIVAYNGAVSVQAFGMFHEGAGNRAFYAVESVGADGPTDLYLDGLQYDSGVLQYIADVSGLYTKVGLRNIRLTNAAKVIKAVGVSSVTVEDCGAGPDILTPDNFPALYELDTYSRWHTTYRGQGVVWSGNNSDARGITELLRPYAKDVIDPGVFAKRTLSGTVITSVTGVLGATASATLGSAGNFVAADAAVKNQPGLLFAAGQGITFNFGATIPNTDRAWLFVVARATSAASGRVQPEVTSASGDRLGTMFWDTGGPFQQAFFVTGGVEYTFAPTVVNVNPSAYLAESRTYGNDGTETIQFYINHAVPVQNTNEAPFVGAMNKLEYPGPNAGAGTANSTLYYAAWGGTPLPPGVIKQLMDMSSERWGTL